MTGPAHDPETLGAGETPSSVKTGVIGPVPGGDYVPFLHKMQSSASALIDASTSFDSEVNESKSFHVAYETNRAVPDTDHVSEVEGQINTVHAPVQGWFERQVEAISGKEILDADVIPPGALFDDHVRFHGGDGAREAAFDVQVSMDGIAGETRELGASVEALLETAPEKYVDAMTAKFGEDSVAAKVVGNVVGASVDLLGDGVQDFFNAEAHAFERVGDVVRDATFSLGTVADHTGDAVRDIVTMGEGLAALRYGDVKAFGDAFVDFHRDQAADVVRDIGNAVDLGVDHVRDLGNVIGHIGASTIDKIGDTIDHVLPGVHIEAIDQFGDNLEEGLETLWDGLSGAADGAKNAADDVWEGTKDVAGDVADTVTDWFGF